MAGRSLASIVLICCALSGVGRAEQPRLRVFYTGHSFHMFVPNRVALTAKAAGVKEYEFAGAQSIGGSRVMQHWDKDKGANLARKVLEKGDVDVFTMSPHLKIPDEGIDRFVELGLKHNPKMRFLVQQSWVPFDYLEKRVKDNAERDAAKLDVDKLRADHAHWRGAIEAQVKTLNQKVGRDAVFIVPAGDAVVTLRALVAEGKAPGISKQSDLFTDSIGHGKLPVLILVSYCNYTCITGRSPVGLRVKEPAISAELHDLLQRIAWDTCSTYPMSGVTLSATGRAAEPPKGFRAIFNGKDLTGWHGLNPHSVTKLTGEKKKAALEKQRAEFPKFWTVAGGELINDGHGPYATTDEEFGDIELLLEYKTVAGADSGIYLRGTPQVQIWDSNQVFNPKQPTRKPHLGSGGLFNNTPGTAGRDPLVLADRPFGQWNRFRIRQIGAHTWVWLNDKLVVDGAVMENYWERGQPLPARGPIMLQTHGGEIRWRNLFVRDIGADEAKQVLGARSAEAHARLAKALTLHASFDEGLDADFARGDKTCYAPRGKDLVKAAPTDEVRLDPKAGRFGGALHFTKKNSFRPAFKDAGVLDYNAKNWNATVSVWLRLHPDEDLEPGYCDPVQIIGDDTKKGFIFLEWSKDKPRFFRYAIRPLQHIWNPDNLPWDDIPPQKRPMVQLAKAPFARDAWTHVAFTLENINDKSKPQTGRLYLNGKLQGTIEKWDLTFGWDPARVLLVLGAAYVGHLDDLAVFNRALTDDEVRQLHGLKQGVLELRMP